MDTANLIALAARVFVLGIVAYYFAAVFPRQKKTLATGVGALITGLVGLSAAWTLILALLGS